MRIKYNKMAIIKVINFKGVDKVSYDDCNICGNNDNEGIVLLDTYICKLCEEEIVNLDVLDILNYEYYKNIIKEIWRTNTVVFG